MKQKLNNWVYDDGVLYWVEHHHTSRIGTKVGNLHPNGYMYMNNNLVHRLIWELFYGPIPANVFIDHIDGNKVNNKISNLRLVNASQSSANRGPMKVRPYPKGVRPFQGKFRAYLDCKHLGTYATVEAAFIARQAAETEYHRKEYYK